jgi:GTP-binding protein
MATVALVGRPNTGKSTLFNRFVGGRVAITLREPGITRDRIIRTVEWLGHRFQVIDTGGLVFDSEDKITRQIERQVDVALQEADLAVMVVDGHDGLAPLDEEIAARLRRRGRRFLVAVNKVDAKRDFETSDFHRLGGDKLLPISAEHGIGIDELLDEIIRRLPDLPPPARRRALSLAILGRPNVGKSSFLNALLGDERAIVTDIPGTTRDVVEEDVRFEGRNYRLLDTAGIRRKARVHEAVEYFSVTRAIDVVERCDVVLLMFDATEGPTAQDQRLAHLIDERSRGLVLVANKMDLVPGELDKKVRDWVASRLDFVDYAPTVFASVINNQGVTETVRRASEVYDGGSRQVSNALLHAAVLGRLEQRPPKYNCRVLGISQVGTRPPSFKVRLTRPDAASDAWRRFAVHLIRRAYGFEGYPIRIRVGR